MQVDTTFINNERYTHSRVIVRSWAGVVGRATHYRLEDPGLNAGGGEIFRTYPDRLCGPPSLLYDGYRVFPGGKGGRGVVLATHSPLVC